MGKKLQGGITMNPARLEELLESGNVGTVSFFNCHLCDGLMFETGQRQVNGRAYTLWQCQECEATRTDEMR